MSFRHLHVQHAIAMTALLAAGSTWAQAPQTKATPPASATTAESAAASSAAATTPAAPGTAAPAAPAAPAQTPSVANPMLGDAKAGATKAAVCGACHGIDGNPSDKQYPKLAGQNEAYIVRQLQAFKSQQRKNPVMVGFASALSVPDMHDIGAYFASKSSLPGVADAKLLDRGQALYRGGDAQLGVPACMACHGPDGHGMAGTGFPQLASQWTDYVSAKLTDWKNGVTWGDDARAHIMPVIAKSLTIADIDAVASYVEGLHTADAGTTTVAK